jgi:hypothetical protein
MLIDSLNNFSNPVKDIERGMEYSLKPLYSLLFQPSSLGVVRVRLIWFINGILFCHLQLGSLRRKER